MIIGITGGVGCGKSAVMDLLKEEFGAETIMADNVGHDVMLKGNEAYEEIIQCFGKDVLDNDTDEIDRKKLGTIVFNNKESLNKLNSIIHPAVKRKILEAVRKWKQSDDDNDKKSRLFAIEAALLLEDNYDEICDIVLYIYADEKVRRRRLKESRGYSEEKIDSIMKNQFSEKEFKEMCDEVIDNSEDICKTRENLQKVLDKYNVL